MNERILIVEDEPKIARLLADYLAGSDFASDHLAHGDDVIPWLEDRPREALPALVLLDLMLPGTDGLTLCRELRQRWPRMPVIMLTARVEEVDRLLGLELGADDYICKPFSPREVIARLKAVLRRAAAAPQATRDLAARLVVDEQRFEARVDGHAVTLTPVEFRLLRHLAAQPGRVYSRDTLIDAVYPDHRVVSERTIDSHVKNLRHKLQAAGLDAIGSVYGVGYRLEWLPAEDAAP